MFADRISRITPSPTLQVNAQARAMKARGIDVIDLSAGQPDFPTPDNVKQAACDAIASDFTRYTDNEGIPELRAAIAEKLRVENGVTYSTDEVLVSCGAKHSLFNACMALIGDGDQVLIPRPYWVSYPAQVSLAGGDSIFVDFREDGGFLPDFDDLEAKCNDRVKLLFLNNPSNPTGAVYRRNDLLRIGALAIRHDFWLLADEIYEKLVFDGSEHICVAALSPEIRARTIVINGVSKSHAMTGWRIGYAAGPGDLISAMKKVQSHSTSNATSISQRAALEAIAGPQEAVRTMNETFRQRRDLLLEKLSTIAGLRVGPPPGTFYLFCGVQELLGRAFRGQALSSSLALAGYLLEQAHVAVVAGEAFGAPGYLRLSYASAPEELEEAARRISGAITLLD